MSNYHKIYDCDLVNGPGVRVTVFLSGCDHGCKGCYNTSTWDPDSGMPYTDETHEYILSRCNRTDGLSISGGDPFHPRNRDTVFRLARDFRNMYPNKSLWIWTGYLFSDIKDDQQIKRILEFVDVVVDGKYEQNNPTQKPWRGSDNQNLIEIKNL